MFSRKNLPKFGEALGNDINVTLISPDFVKLEHPDDILNDDGEDVALGGTLAGFILKQQERQIEREYEYDRDKDYPGLVNSNEEAGASKAGGTYVPPGMRGGAANLSSAPGSTGRSTLENAFGAKGDDNTENTIKVSNLTKNVTEEDLKVLFGRFGNIYRVSLPKVEKKEDGKIFKEPKGFAYVAYYSKRDAETAMEKLQGHGYDHLILKLEWAKPQKEGSGGGGGGGDQYRSGYGQKLAQETTEKVSYASNLTGNR